MNYTQPMISDFPYSNPVTKIACAVGLLYVGYMAVRSTKVGDDITPVRRKNRKGVMDGVIDKAIDEKNRLLGGGVPSNPDIPYYSRQNHNRRRKGRQ